MNILWQLFLSFFKTGLFTFGGGYAMLPLLREEVVIRHHWLKEDELLDYFSIGQCTPGIIAVNIATFCGYRLRGIVGALTATLAIIFPSLIIISLIATVLQQFMDASVISNAFAGIRIGVTALLANLIIDMSKKVYKGSHNRFLHIFIFISALFLLFFANISAIAIVVFSILLGFLPQFVFVKSIVKRFKGGKK